MRQNRARAQWSHDDEVQGPPAAGTLPHSGELTFIRIAAAGEIFA